MKHRNLILLRGVSGAGKSTVAELFTDAVLVSTDDYFMEKEWCTICDDGEPVDAICNEDHNKYVFNRDNLANNHQKCQDDVEQTMQDLIEAIEYDKKRYRTHTDIESTIVVHNTFTKKWEMEPYLILAAKYDYTVHTLIVENRHGSNSIHDVPQKSINDQHARFDVVLAP